MSMSYTVIVRCQNCRYERTVRVERGELVSEFLKKNEVVCNNCECPDARLVVANVH